MVLTLELDLDFIAHRCDEVFELCEAQLRQVKIEVYLLPNELGHLSEGHALLVFLEDTDDGILDRLYFVLSLGVEFVVSRAAVDLIDIFHALDLVCPNQERLVVPEQVISYGLLDHLR